MFEHSSGDFERPPYSARCKFCDKAEFEWEMRGPQWKLTCRDGSIHDCRAISKTETTSPTPREQELEAQLTAERTMADLLAGTLEFVSAHTQVDAAQKYDRLEKYYAHRAKKA